MKVRKAVIPAAGFGTRFLPATKAQPKEMLNVVDKPLIQYSVEEAVDAGIESIGIITSRGKSAIEDHFDISPELEHFLEEKKKLDLLEEIRRISNLAEFCYIRQKQALGLGHAILMAESFVGSEPFSVLLPDDIFDCDVPCIKQLLKIHQKYNATVIVLMQVDEEGMNKYGIVKSKQISERVFKLEDMAEKPGPRKAFSNLAILGRYVFTPKIFEMIKHTSPDHKGEIQITDAIKLLLEEEPVYGYLFEGNRYDCGDKFGYIQASLKLALKRPEFKEPLSELFIKNVDTNDNS